jgi:hypothetical protein
MNDHTETIAYSRADVIRDNLAKMARDPDWYTPYQFAAETRSAIDLIDALNNRVADLEKMLKFHQENPNDAMDDLQRVNDGLNREVRGLVMELELEEEKNKNLRATVVSQAEHICHLMSVSRSCDEIRQIRDARNADGYEQDRG